MLLDTMNATKWQKLTMLVLPANTPTIIAALKINVGLSWVGSIMGEYLVSRAGLGYLIIYGGQVFDLDLVMTSTIVLCVLAAAMYAFVAVFEKAVNKNSMRKRERGPRPRSVHRGTAAERRGSRTFEGSRQNDKERFAVFRCISSLALARDSFNGTCANMRKTSDKRLFCIIINFV